MNEGFSVPRSSSLTKFVMSTLSIGMYSILKHPIGAAEVKNQWSQN